MGSRILSLTIRRLPERAVRSRRAQSETAGFTAPSSAWLFPGSQPASRSCSWKCSTLWKSDAKMNSIHLATPCKMSGLNNLPRLTEQAFGRTQICRAPFRWLNQDSIPCPAAFITALSTSTANETGTCRKQHPLLTCPPNSPWAWASVVPTVAERTCDTKSAAWFACTSGAGASVQGFPKFWVWEFTILHYILWIRKSGRDKMEGVFLLENCLWMVHPAFTESWWLLLQYIYFETQFISCKKLLRPLILEANAERSWMLRILIMLGLGNLMNKRDFS